MPIVFDRVCDASGAFIVTFRAVVAQVVGAALHVVPGCCRLTVCIFRFCAGWLFATGIVDVVRGVCDLVLCVPSSCSVSGTLGSATAGCTLETVASLFCLGTLEGVPWIDVASTKRVRSGISCSCYAMTNGLRFSTLTRSDMAFMILLACDKDGFVMFFCLKCTVSDNRSLWVDLIWHVVVR